jgi:NAD(P)-dependent dehydrogenase (short-subunit alcohol dehydrogenase family)
VTGSTDGLGRRLAGELAARGGRVLVHGRDAAKVDGAAREVGAAGAFVADLASLAVVRRLAEEVEELDTLVNNAGVGAVERSETPDGHMLTFTVNYLSHFLLTLLLLPKLREPGRIVNVASIGQAPLDLDDLMLARGYEASAPTRRASWPRSCSRSSSPGGSTAAT